MFHFISSDGTFSIRIRNCIQGLGAYKGVLLYTVLAHRCCERKQAARMSASAQRCRSHGYFVKDGGLWIVVDGRAYDVQDWKGQAPCGADNLINCANADATQQFQE